MEMTFTREQLAEAMQWYFSYAKWGLSSDAMFREALGLPQRLRTPCRPWDEWDSEGIEETFVEAPDWMKPLMQPRLDWYREIKRLGWPTTPPDRMRIPPAAQADAESRQTTGGVS